MLPEPKLTVGKYGTLYGCPAPCLGHRTASVNQARRGRHLLGVYSEVYDVGRQATLSLFGLRSQFRRVTVMAARGPKVASPRPQPENMTLPIAAAADGDEAAFARIVAAHHDDMVRVCFVITRDTDAAHDAVQEAWAIAWRKLRELREPERLRQWLVAIAANEARQTMRRQRRRVVTELRAEGPPDDDEGTRLWSGQIDLRNALARLSVADRELLALRYVAGFDLGELSKVTGLSASGTRARLQRLLATLRNELEPDNG